jgi:membrane-bound ClpP family serine protease
MGFAVSGCFRDRATGVSWVANGRRRVSRLPPPSRTAAITCLEPPLIILGVILLIIGFIAKVAIIWTIGIIAVVVGAILALLGMAGHAVGARRHYF